MSHKPVPKLSDIADEYERLWETCKVKGDWGLSAAKKMIAARPRYKGIEAETGVPWAVVGIIHMMEAGGRFTRHLHNGDPLRSRTVQKPAGRPPDGEPPFSWEESALDAIHYDGLDKVEQWSIAELCYRLEGYNGWGYRLYHPETLSPYLWSGTNHYSRGKYVKDGKWSSRAVSKQPGAMAILKQAAKLDPSVLDFLKREQTVDVASVPLPTRKPDRKPTPLEMRKKSRKWRLLDWLKSFFGIGAAGTAFIGSSEGIETSTQWLKMMSGWITTIKTFATEHGVLLLVGLGIVAYVIVQIVQNMQLQDAAEGRYVPSGEVKK